MRLQQGQTWITRDSCLRIVQWERLRIVYKETASPDTKDGTLHDVSKKEFCRLIKGATLHQPTPGEAPPTGEDPDPSPPAGTDTINRS